MKNRVYFPLFTLLMFISQAQAVEKKQQGITKALELNTDISPKDQKISADILNKLLADEFVLLAKTLNYHWNLVGPEFHDYHILFNDQYHVIFELTDQIAERARAVGGIALGSMADFIASSTLKEDNGDIPAPKDMVSILLHDHEAIIRSFREGINVTAEDNRDIGTSNFLTEIMQKHEKIAWMLRSLLERRK
jgi:starvation-inducible DNA-binding protein